ncbi:MAG: hypothetical protein ACFFD4_14150 [Candidatus Odinarchaeota archaeon]
MSRCQPDGMFRVSPALTAGSSRVQGRFTSINHGGQWLGRPPLVKPSVPSRDRAGGYPRGKLSLFF